MKVAYLCGLFPHSIEDQIREKSKGVAELAANTLQWAILDGMNQLDLFADVFTLPYIRSYPLGYRSLFIKPDHLFLNNRIKLHTVGFCNLVGYHFISRYLGAKRELLNWAGNSSGEKTIMVYALHSPFLKAVSDIKKRYPQIKICLIVPDLPQYMSESRSLFYRILKKIDSHYMSNLLENINSFVFLSEFMAQALQIKDKPWITVEGIYTQAPDNKIKQKEKYKTILYTGTLNRRYGIMNLIEAFVQIKDSNYRLWICGEGNCSNDIKDISRTDNRITSFGQITHNEVLGLQKRATVLVNPRSSEDEYTKYSFPSKTLEYFASGTPTIMNRLKGIPEEYFQYCFTPVNDNVKELKRMIVTVCEKKQSELEEIGEKASGFIFAHKNPEAQVRKIFEMLDKLQ